MKEKVNLDELYFGIKLFSLSYANENERTTLKTYNLFDFSRVKWSVARYVTMSDKEKKTLLSDPLHFCFGDVWGRCEYEYLIRPMVSDNKGEVKTDVFQMYVEPNAKYLMSIVNRITKTSAQKYLREERKRLKGRK